MEYRTEPVAMWFDWRLVMRPSPIHGIGTFATHAIRAGERLIWVSGGIVYTSEDWRTGRVQLAPEQYNEGQIGDDLFIATPKSLGYYVNHSCDPNMLDFTAWRDIAAGEEITTDFAYCTAAPNYCLEAAGVATALPWVFHPAHRALDPGTERKSDSLIVVDHDESTEPPGGPTRACSRPLRARDRWHFSAFWCRARGG